MDQKTKEELIKLALGKSKEIVPYTKSLGFDDWQKFKTSFGLQYSDKAEGIPCPVVYLFYYKWVRESGKKPVSSTKFFQLCGKNKLKSYINKNEYLNLSFRCYRLKHFPHYTVYDEVEARKLIREEKEKKHNRARKKVLQSKV